MITSVISSDVAGRSVRVAVRVTGCVTGRSSGIGRGAPDVITYTGNGLISRFTFPGAHNNVAAMAGNHGLIRETPAPAKAVRHRRSA